jgi:ankyrin repeat protein
MKSYSESRKNEPDNPEHKMSKCPVPMMQQALSEKANMNWRNPEWDGATLLLKAVRTGTNVLTEYLLLADKGADPSVVDDSGRGIFHWAAMSGDAAQFQLLIENVPVETRPPINGLDSGGDTPLHLAAYYGHLAIIRQLIHIKADPKMENRAGNSPVELAEIRRMWHVVSYLTESKQQKEDEECDPADFKIENLARPCNMVRKNGLAEVAKLNPKPKPKAKAKK